jgi:ankyrin repeat protein
LALFRAAQRNDLAGVQRELEKAVFPQEKAGFSQEVRLALRVAVRNDCAAVVLHMPCFLRNRISSLRYATESGSVQVMRNFLKMEPRLRGRVHVNFCLGRACRFGQKIAAQYLVDYKADVDRRENGCAPLHLAASQGHAGVVMRLLQAKASLTSPAEIGGSSAESGGLSARHKYIRRLLQRALQVNGRVKSEDVKPKDV